MKFSIATILSVGATLAVAAPVSTSSTITNTFNGIETTLRTFNAYALKAYAPGVADQARSIDASIKSLTNAINHVPALSIKDSNAVVAKAQEVSGQVVSSLNLLKSQSKLLKGSNTPNTILPALKALDADNDKLTVALLNIVVKSDMPKISGAASDIEVVLRQNLALF